MAHNESSRPDRRLRPPSTVSPQRLAELDHRRRRTAIIRTALSIAAAWILLFAGYYLLPLDERNGARIVARLIVALVLFVFILLWQTRSIARAGLPQLRAIRALGVIIPLFILLFAGTYESLSLTDANHFSEPMDHTGALYLTITIFSTVGFGDITPKDDLTRLIVSVQMLADLVLVGTVFRVLLHATNTALSTDPGPADAQPEGPANPNPGPAEAASELLSE